MKWVTTINMEDYSDLIANVISIDKLSGTRRQPKPKLAHEQRRTRAGRRELSASGSTDRHSWDMSTRPFVALDGEGITYDKELPQAYVLLACSTGQYIKNAAQEGLASQRCFEFLLRLRFENPRAIFLGFSIGYDAEMMMKDFSDEGLRKIHTYKVHRWKAPDGTRYTIRYIPKKWFIVTGVYQGKQVTCRIFDVWSFFGTGFVATLEEHLPEVPEDDLEHIIAGKNQRDNFTDEELESEVIPYCKLELKYSVDLMTRFRELLNQAGIYPKSWHGPGALASFLFELHGIEAHMNRDLPDDILDASQYAFAAGRMEKFKTGRSGKPVYKHDLRSAYPAAMVRCPSLAGRAWKERSFDPKWQLFPKDIQDFGMYLITYQSPNERVAANGLRFPEPLFKRSVQGYINFPADVTGWYWGPEVKAAMAVGHVRVSAGWELDMTDMVYPFEWLKDMFAKRMEWKAQGIAAQVGLKLGPNSLFGKTCQRTGWRKDGDKIPKWHQYEWAGFITSTTRAEVFRVANMAAEMGCLIGIETDAVLTDAPLPLVDNKQLGDWETEVYPDIIYLQTGQYFLKTDLTEWSDDLERKGYQQDSEGGIWKNKFRGFDRKTLTIGRVLEFLESTSFDVMGEDKENVAITKLPSTRFVTSKGALHEHRMGEWRRWITKYKDLKILIDYKRTHLPGACRMCRAGKVYGSEGMHDMIIRRDKGADNETHASKLPWRRIEGEAVEWDSDITPREEPSFNPEASGIG
jgi:hypothetical protein